MECKGISKFSGFGIAREIEIESIRNGETSRFVMNYDRMLKQAANRAIEFKPLAATDRVSRGTRTPCAGSPDSKPDAFRYRRSADGSPAGSR